MFVFVVGMERCGTHSAANIVKAAVNVPAHIVHEEEPTLCQEAKLLYDGEDFRNHNFKKKLAVLRSHKKKNTFVFEANHRLSFFSTLLMREFAPDCKIIFLVRDPIATITSRIATWAYYKEFEYMYPNTYLDEIKHKVMLNKRQFNDFRLSPPKFYAEKKLGELYAWEWLETYKYARRELHNIPHNNRKIMRCEDLTSNFRGLLEFIGWEYFNITDEVVGWSRTKSDSVYFQDRYVKSDAILTQNRDPDRDGPLIFAKDIINKCYNDITAYILEELRVVPKIDRDLIDMDIMIENYIKVGPGKNNLRTFL